MWMERGSDPTTLDCAVERERMLDMTGHIP